MLISMFYNFCYLIFIFLYKNYPQIYSNTEKRKLQITNKFLLKILQYNNIPGMM